MNHIFDLNNRLTKETYIIVVYHNDVVNYITAANGNLRVDQINAKGSHSPSAIPPVHVDIDKGGSKQVALTSDRLWIIAQILPDMTVILSVMSADVMHEGDIPLPQAVVQSTMRGRPFTHSHPQWSATIC